MTDLALPETSNAVTFSDQQVDTLRRTIALDANDHEMDLFLSQCKRTQLDPFTRQIYFMKTGGRPTVVVSIDGFRLIAARSGIYAGQTPPQWCGPDGQWQDVWLSDAPPAAARVGVYRKGVDHPVWGVVTWKEFGQGKSSTWKAMPSHMLAKVAESHALRKAFPNEMSGLYTADEMRAAGAAKVEEKMTTQETASIILKTCDAMPESNRVKLVEWVTSSTGVPFNLEGLMSLPVANGEKILDQARKAKHIPPADAPAEVVEAVSYEQVQLLVDGLNDDDFNRFEQWLSGEGVKALKPHSEAIDLLKMHSWLRANNGDEAFLAEA